MFSSFPHIQLVVPIVVLATATSECTCTLLWLLKYTKFYFNFHLFQYRDSIDTINTLENNQTAVSVCFRTSNIYDLMESCNFTEKFNKCIQKSAANSVDYYSKTFSLFNENINLLYTLKWFQYLIEVFLRPLLCLLGLITNLLILRILHAKSKTKNFKSPMYRHMTFNSLFNLFYCFLNMITLINICVFDKSSFCSLVYKRDTSQYFKIYGIHWLGNSLKFCSNFSFITTSISRCISSTISSASSKLQHFNEQMNVKLYYFIMFSFSLSLNLFKLFEFKVNEMYSSGYDKMFPFNAYDIKYCEQPTFSDIESFWFKCELFWTLDVINISINNVLVLFISLLVDALMIRFSSKLIENKKAINCPHLSEAIKYKTNLNKMILINGCLFFVSHVPDFVTTLLLIVYKQRLAEFCYSFFSCSELVEMAQAFHLLSISLNFFIFKHFDHNFNR